MDEDLTDTLDECLKMLDDNVDILSNIELDLEDEKEDEIQTDMKLCHLYDMTEDVSKSARLKTAEEKFMRRQNEN